MQVKNALSNTLAVVHNKPKGILHAFLAGHLVGSQNQVPEQGLVFFTSIDNPGDGFSGDDQDVHRGLGVRITKGHTLVIFVDDIGGNFPGDDPAKNCLVHGVLPRCDGCGEK